MSKRVLFIDDGDGVELELEPSADEGTAARIILRDFGVQGVEASFDLSEEDVEAFLSEFRAAREATA